MPEGQAHSGSVCSSVGIASNSLVDCVVHNRSLQLCTEMDSLVSMVWSRLCPSSWPPAYAGCMCAHAVEEMPSLMTETDRGCNRMGTDPTQGGTCRCDSQLVTLHQYKIFPSGNSVHSCKLDPCASPSSP